MKTFKKKLKEAGALLISTPESNYSVPGVLKMQLIGHQNLIEKSFDGKPVAIERDARAQFH